MVVRYILLIYWYSRREGWTIYCAACLLGATENTWSSCYVLGSVIVRVFRNLWTSPLKFEILIWSCKWNSVMKQSSFADLEYQHKKKKTRKERFLGSYCLSLSRYVSIIQPRVMVGDLFLQKWCCVSISCSSGINSVIPPWKIVCMISRRCAALLAWT